MNIPNQPTAPLIPEDPINKLCTHFECDMHRCFTATVSEVNKHSARIALETLQRAGFHIINVTDDLDDYKTYIVATNPYKEKRQMDLADRLKDLLIEEGQRNGLKYDFHLGDTIKFTPDEVAEIVRESGVRI